MLKKKFLFLCSILSLSLINIVQAHISTIPDEFTVTERWISLTPTFDISSKTEKLGTVHRKIFSLMPQYQLMDVNENLIASARMRFLTLFAVFDVKDYQDNPLGTVEQEFSFFFPTFRIISPQKQILAEAVMNFWKTKFILSHPVDGHVIATISRPWLRLKSNWVIKIEDPRAVVEGNIHPHLLMTLAAFQVDREYWEAYRKKNQHNEDSDVTVIIFDKMMSLDSTKKVSNEELPLFKESALALDSIQHHACTRLEKHRKKLSSYPTNESDYSFIESLEASNVSKGFNDIDTLETKFDELLDLLDSDEINTNQKAALFNMLDSRIN